MILYLSSGFFLGLTAGVAPGPLLALVVSQTLTYGAKEGLKTALAPLITDPPIILMCMFLGTRLTSHPLPLGLLSMAGAVYLGYLAWENVNIASTGTILPSICAKSIQKGVLTNFLNPHPYLFWVMVGTPLMVKALTAGYGSAALWMITFYTMLVGSKMVLSFIVGRWRGWLQGKVYLWLNRLLALAMVLFAAMLVKDGLKMAGI